MEMGNHALPAAILLAGTLGGAGAQAQTPIPPSPKDFAMAVAESDQYEIMAATVAEAQSQDPRVKDFAQKMIEQHTRLDDELRKAAMAAGLPPLERAMSSDQASWLASLQGVRGSDFDKTYARQQELAHVQAVAVVGSFAKDGADPNLRKAAEAALPVIEDHLKMARQLGADVGAS